MVYSSGHTVTCVGRTCVSFGGLAAIDTADHQQNADKASGYQKVVGRLQPTAALHCFEGGVWKQMQPDTTAAPSPRMGHAACAVGPSTMIKRRTANWAAVLNRV